MVSSSRSCGAFFPSVCQCLENSKSVLRVSGCGVVVNCRLKGVSLKDRYNS